MKLNTNKTSKTRASVLVVALVISAIGTIGVIATVSVIGARAHLAQEDLAGLERRMKLSNSKALARKVIYQKYLPTDAIVNSAETYEVKYAGPDETLGNADDIIWASTQIGAFNKPALSFAEAARTHPTGAAPIRAFSRDVAVTVSDTKYNHPLQYQMRSYNPALSGDLLSVHPAFETTTESVRIQGDLKVKGRAVFWSAPYYQDTPSTMRSEQVIVPINNPPRLVLENPDEVEILPSNYVGFTQTMGALGSGNTYIGELSLVDNPTTGVNSYFQRLTALGSQTNVNGGVSSTDGLGPVTIAPRPNDATLLALIQDPLATEAAVAGQLAANSPLSSDIMLAALNRVPAMSESYIVPLLNAQTPLPDDIMVYLSNPTAPLNASTKKALLKNTGFSHISDGKGTVTVNLESVYLPNLLIENASQLFLEGQDDGTSANAAALLQPRAIAIKNSDNVFLSHVFLDGITNKRRIALAISQTGVLDNADLIDTLGAPSTWGTNQTSFVFISPDPFVEWSLITETEGVNQSWDVSSVTTAKLIGGIRTDYSIRVNGGTLTLEREEDTEFIESLVSRNAWIEIYK